MMGILTHEWLNSMFDFVVLMLKSGLYENEFLNVFNKMLWFRLDWMGINKQER